MDRASMMFNRDAQRARPDDFEDTVPNGLESAPLDFADTVPYDLDDELGEIAPTPLNRPGPNHEGWLFGGSLPEQVSMPASFKRQALVMERRNEAASAGFPDTVYQAPADFLASDQADSRVVDSRPGEVTSKGGQVRPAHLCVSADVEEDAIGGVALPTLRMVGISDLRQVTSHVSSRVAGATRHIVRFRNGGFVRFAYGIDDSVVELSGERITVRIGLQGDVLITAHRPSGAP